MFPYLPCLVNLTMKFLRTVPLKDNSSMSEHGTRPVLKSHEHFRPVSWTDWAGDRRGEERGGLLLVNFRMRETGARRALSHRHIHDNNKQIMSRLQHFLYYGSFPVSGKIY